jgi:predicted RNase H-like HicB family nuclease
MGRYADREIGSPKKGGNPVNKELEYYLGLPYEVEIVPIPETEGGGFMARLPQFGAAGIIGDGETEDEALRDLAANRKDRFMQYLAEGLPVPEPTKILNHE